MKTAKPPKSTSDAVAILAHMTGNEPSMKALIEAERANLQVATEIYTPNLCETFTGATRGEGWNHPVGHFPTGRRRLQWSLPCHAPADRLSPE